MGHYDARCAMTRAVPSIVLKENGLIDELKMEEAHWECVAKMNDKKAFFVRGVFYANGSTTIKDQYTGAASNDCGKPFELPKLTAENRWEDFSSMMNLLQGAVFLPLDEEGIRLEAKMVRGEDGQPMDPTTAQITRKRVMIVAAYELGHNYCHYRAIFKHGCAASLVKELFTNSFDRLSKIMDKSKREQSDAEFMSVDNLYGINKSMIHALTNDLANGLAMSKSQRAKLHRKIDEVIEKQFTKEYIANLEPIEFKKIISRVAINNDLAPKELFGEGELYPIRDEF